jgi:hypothetical protein
MREVAFRLFHAALGWLVPGAGHFLRGERLKGVLFALAVIGCFLAGEAMAEFRAVSRYEHDIAYYAQIGAGAPTIGCDWYDSAHHGPYPRRVSGREVPISVPRLLDCGIMYTCVAGLLNFVLVVDLLFPLPGTARRRREDTE